MIKHYIEYYYPGSFFPETSVEEVEERGAIVSPKKNKYLGMSYGFRYFSREVLPSAESPGEFIKGKSINKGKMHYWGEEYTKEDVENLSEDTGMLLSNMKSNKWKTVIRTNRGNFQPNENCVVLSPPKQ